MLTGMCHAVTVQLANGVFVSTFNLRQSILQTLGFVFFNAVAAHDGDFFFMFGDQNHAHVFRMFFAMPNQVLHTFHEYRKNQF